MKEVTIVINFKIYLYLFEPIIRFLLKKEVKIYVAVPDNILSDVQVILEGLEITYLSLTKIGNQHWGRYYIHRVLATLLTRRDFSFQYQKKIEQTTKKYSGFQGLLLKIARFTPKIPNNKINQTLHKIVGWGLSNPFPTQLVMVGSLNASPELLTSKEQKVITVMESWDHPVKHPNGYLSKKIYTWNKSLSLDWVENQFENNCTEFYPLKLRYPLKNRLNSDNIVSKKKKVLMYAISSTSRFSINVLSSLDLRIIEELIIATRQAGWSLVLKPRPNGTDGEFDHFSKHDHVEVLPINDHVYNPADYYLDDDYNRKRFSDLNKVTAVVNAFTTFGLDAACYGIPVIQIDLRKNLNFSDSWMVYNNHHIKTHLLSRENILTINEGTLNEKISDVLKGDLSFAKKYSDEIYDWLTNGLDIDSALEKLYKSEFE